MGDRKEVCFYDTSYISRLFCSRASWFKLKTPKFLPHECRLQYLLDHRIIDIVLASTDSEIR